MVSFQGSCTLELSWNSGTWKLKCSFSKPILLLLKIFSPANCKPVPVLIYDGLVLDYFMMVCFVNNLATFHRSYSSDSGSESDGESESRLSNITVIPSTGTCFISVCRLLFVYVRILNTFLVWAFFYNVTLLNTPKFIRFEISRSINDNRMRRELR